MGDKNKKVAAHTGPKKEVFLTNTIRIWNTELIFILEIEYIVCHLRFTPSQLAILLSHQQHISEKQKKI
jgi:hypothetical protein